MAFEREPACKLRYFRTVRAFDEIGRYTLDFPRRHLLVYRATAATGYTSSKIQAYFLFVYA